MKLQQFSSAVLLLASLGLIAAQEFEYAEYALDREPNDSLPLAGSVTDIEYIYPPFLSLDICRASCNAAATCIGLAYAPNIQCVTFAVGTAFNGIDAANKVIAWKYDATAGPTCHRATDTITGPGGGCTCGFASQEQDTPFGCTAFAPSPGPSQALRHRSRRSRIMPGVTDKALF